MILFKILAWLAGIAVLLVILGYLSLILLGGYLTPSDNLSKSDVIVVLSGGTDRTEWGIKLYQDGWAPRLLFVGAAQDKSGPSNAAAMRQEAVAAGIPETAIFTEDKSTNTLENAQFSKVILDQIGAKKFILVTSPYHQRRVFETFNYVYGNSGIEIINSPSGYSAWNAKAWWEKPASSDVTISEVLKIMWAKLIGEYS